MVSPHGTDPGTVFDRIYAGESVIRGVEIEGMPWIPGPIPLAPVDFEAGDIIPRVQRIFMARVSEFATVAAYGALTTAGLLVDDSGPTEAAVYVGCGIGGPEALQQAYRSHYLKGRKFRPTTVPLIMTNGPTSHISMRFGVRGPTLSYSIACASSAVAMGEAFRAIRDGYSDTVLAGGTEALLNSGGVGAWYRLGVLATRHEDGHEVSSRPFDEARTGLVLGEGAVMFMLESEEQVQKRGVQPLGEMVGYGMGSDAHNLTEPH